MATKCLITLHTNNTFLITAFVGVFKLDGVIIGNVNITLLNSTTATATINVDVSIGTHTFELTYIALGISLSSDIITGDFIFKDNNNNTLATKLGVGLSFNLLNLAFDTGAVSVNISCLHGDSLIQTKNDIKKIKDIERGDEVLTGNNIFVKVLDLVQCWIQINGNPNVHDAIVFEKNSLGLNEPSERLIIDPGHPICTKIDYQNKGIYAFKKAGEFIGFAPKDQIYVTKWDSEICQNNSLSDSNQKLQSIRYDLVLDSPNENYIANNIVVKSRKLVEIPGYNHAYEGFV